MQIHIIYIYIYTYYAHLIAHTLSSVVGSKVYTIVFTPPCSHFRVHRSVFTPGCCSCRVVVCVTCFSCYTRFAGARSLLGSAQSSSLRVHTSLFTDGAYTKGTRAHTHRELIREWLWDLPVHTSLFTPGSLGRDLGFAWPQVPAARGRRAPLVCRRRLPGPLHHPLSARSGRWLAETLRRKARANVRFGLYKIFVYFKGCCAQINHSFIPRAYLHCPPWCSTISRLTLPA